MEQGRITERCAGWQTAAPAWEGGQAVLLWMDMMASACLPLRCVLRCWGSSCCCCALIPLDDGRQLGNLSHAGDRFMQAAPSLFWLEDLLLRTTHGRYTSLHHAQTPQTLAAPLQTVGERTCEPLPLPHCALLIVLVG